MGAAKWIGGLIGWITIGPIGGLIGFLLGTVADSSRINVVNESSTQGNDAYVHNNPRNSFLVSLLVLSTAVIKADGKYMKSELDYVREFIRRSFSDAAVPEAMAILKELKDKDINVYQVGAQIRINMNLSQRLQLFHYLVELARADGAVCNSELDMLRTIASSLGISRSDADSILAMFEAASDSAYKVLEVEPSATDDEVKRAYKRLAMKNHPDKVASLGPDVQKAAEEKFKKIQAAYDKIKKERNLK